jgi:hypothetical protein
MGAFSNYAEEKFVEHFLRNNAITSPVSTYLSLFESDPGEAADGTETSYTSYARIAAVWTSLDGAGQTKNSGSISFAANGNASASVTITHAAVFDSLTTGNCIIYGPLAASKTLAVGDVLSFAANALVLTLD